MKPVTKKMRRAWKQITRKIVIHRPNVKVAKAVRELRS